MNMRGNKNMVTFLNETLRTLEDNELDFEDVIWIGSKDGYISKELFLKLADVYYDSGYGAAEIAEDLVIVGDNWWLERREYDGSEWWEFKSLPSKSKHELKPKRLNGGMWSTLKDMEGK